MEKENIHSVEVNKMMDNIPYWTIRCGGLCVFTFLCFIVLASCYIKIPQTIKTDIVLNINKKKNGNLKLIGDMYVSSLNMCLIKNGMPVVVKSKNNTDVLTGKISHISNTTESNRGYKVEVVFYCNDFELFSGMKGKARIQIAKKSLICYFLESIGHYYK